MNAELETKLRNMTQTAKSMNGLLSVVREEDMTGGPYLVVEHEDYGHVTELHAEDYPHHKEILRDALEFVSSHEELPPWD